MLGWCLDRAALAVAGFEVPHGLQPTPVNWTPRSLARRSAQHTGHRWLKHKSGLMSKRPVAGVLCARLGLYAGDKCPSLQRMANQTVSAQLELLSGQIGSARLGWEKIRRVGLGLGVKSFTAAVPLLLLLVPLPPAALLREEGFKGCVTLGEAAWEEVSAEEERGMAESRDPDLGGATEGHPGLWPSQTHRCGAGERPGLGARGGWQGSERWEPGAAARSCLPPTVDVGDGWGYPRLPLSLRCIFYKGAGTEQTGFQLVSVFSVVTLSIKFPALTMGGGVGCSSGHTDWAGVPTACA